MPTSTTLTSPVLSEWLNGYDNHSSVFASPACSIMAQGQVLQLRASNTDRQLAVKAQQLLDRAKAENLPGFIMGVLPFNTNKPAHLFVPRSLDIQARLQPAATPSAPTTYTRANLTAHPRAQEYEQLVSAAVPVLDGTPLSKIVLARTIDVQLERPLARRQLLENLIRLNPHGYSFGINLQDDSNDNACFFGASPELLVRRTGAEVSINPLAGTAARVANAADDLHVGQALLASEKDRHEHAIVIDTVVQALAPYCAELHVPDGPELAKTATLWHLSTSIRGILKAPYASSLELALAMHPTPAVCGAPTLHARDFIEGSEPFEREYFAGAAGWCDANGDGEWAVAIRCGKYERQQIRLYAGAGIVSASDPKNERQETGNKLRTMLNALSIDPDLIEQGIHQ
ncbi:isochorismate synthase [Paenalcaligenes niemegkensis]|uniref:isochorismate synthase n=1 Tax=Paenalcaligenes niemegkensis TaxID=2895469 RepID=UPI001EE7A943|nr:isochorismate synthase [Paenalcaligenes niemegkensis]MCQ9617595.1 isochorismate synthase [Paenalcaligenes niemegkensis]